VAAKRGDDKAWNEFVSWCGERGLEAVPANPWTLAAYARWSERHHPYPAVARNIEAIARVHYMKTRKRLDRHPMVMRTLSLIETRAKAKKSAKDKQAALFPEDDILERKSPGKAKAGKTRKAAGKTPATAKGKRTARKKPRKGMSASPKLVSRRRLKS
jgi:hypothetical protein|tara:strand:- start:57 stop:530 length:474 start_codon:yes stop_codon:yes gene_type:complete